MDLHPRWGMFHLASIIGVVAALVLGFGTSFGQDNAQRPRVGLSVWDTSQTNAQQLAPETLEEKNGWKAVGTADTAHAFQGDAVISNGRLLAVARQQGTGIELYSLGSGKPVYRGRLVLVPGVANDRIALMENSRAAVGLEVASKSGTARFRLKKGDLFIEIQNGMDTQDTALRLECPSRFAVLPDFFADDILFDARKVPVDNVELPSENFLLHFTGKQDAIVMAVFENRAQDVRVTLAGAGHDRAI